MPDSAATKMEVVMEAVINSGHLEHHSAVTDGNINKLCSSNPDIAHGHAANPTLSANPPITRPKVMSSKFDITSSDSEDSEKDDGQDSDAAISIYLTSDEVKQRVAALSPHNTEATLQGIPTEMQCHIFAFLDKIDSVALALSSPHMYSVYVAIYRQPVLPLNTRRIGPNNLESCWEIVGVPLCGHCGSDRCELWRHIKGWITNNNDLEYCSMKHKFGSPAKPGAALNCYRNKPSKPKRCGRHPIRTTTVHQDDNSRFLAK
jgi:hypothetical protein